MEDPLFASDGSPHSRWYDKDPALSRALKQLREASDRYQAQIALNIIKIVIEHRIESRADSEAEMLDEWLIKQNGQPPYSNKQRRWYDVDESLRSAMQLLYDCPDDLQKSVIPSITQMIETTLAQQI